MSDSLHIVCPACHATNRIPAGRQNDQPQCGKCHEMLFAGKPVELVAANFDKHVSKSDIPLVVDFWAEWCGPCKMMAPAFAEAASELEPEFRLGKLDTEHEQALAARFNIRSIPTMVLFQGGREVARQSGAMRTADIVRWVRQAAK